MQQTDILSFSVKGWLAFELNVLRRLKFESVCFPFTGDTTLPAYLKRWNAKVMCNDEFQWSWTQAIADVQNNADVISDNLLDDVLEDVYVPGYELKNLALKDRFGEVDAWWFDNLRRRIDELESPMAHAIALSLGMAVGDYSLSFSERSRQLRQPLSTVFRRMAAIRPKPFDNRMQNICANRSAKSFLAECHAELMFLRLPGFNSLSLRERSAQAAWREEWVRGNSDFWPEIEARGAGRLGAKALTKSQYLDSIEDMLHTASHIGHWAIAFAEDGYVSAQEIVETIDRVRRVETIYTKDFSELMGVKAVIITA
jgi:hypothetical protein